MRVLVAIAGNDLRRIARDRTAMFFVFALPVVIIVIIGTTFGGQQRVEVGVVDHDGTEQSEALRRELADVDALEIATYDEEDAMRRDVRSGAIAGGVVVPDGYGDDLLTAEGAAVELVPDPSANNLALVRAGVDAAVSRQGAIVAAAQFAASTVDLDLDTALADAERLARVIPSVDVDVLTIGDEGLGGGSRFSYSAMSNLVLFVFVNTVAIGALLATDRAQGLIRRLFASPNRPGTLLAGIGGAKFGFAIVQSALLILIGGLVFGVSWGDPAGAAVLVVVFAVTSTAVGLLLGSLATNTEQAQATAVPIAIGLGMLGGCMWPLEIVPEAMRVAGHVTPHAWAMDAWIELVYRDGGLRDIAGELAVLAGFAAVLGVIASRALRRAITG